MLREFLTSVVREINEDLSNTSRLESIYSCNSVILELIKIVRFEGANEQLCSTTGSQET